MQLLIFVPAIILIVISEGIMVLSKRKFGECIPLSILVVTFAIYFSQLIFSTFKVGYAAIIGMTVISLVLYIVNCYKSRKIDLFSQGFITFAILVLIYAVVDYGRRFNNWDEFMTWGIMVKESMRLDAFHLIPETNILNHKEYPPFSTLFEMFWVKFGGGYSEGAISMALHIMQISFITPWVSEYLITEKKDNTVLHRLITAVLTNVLFILLALAFDTDGTKITTNTCVDALFPLMFVYCIMLIYKNADKLMSVFDFICLTIASSAILLVKQVGIAFVLLIWFYYIVINLIKKEKNIKRFILGILLLVLIPVCINKTWSVLVDKYKYKGQFALDKIKFKVYFDSVFNDTGIRSETFRSFIRALYRIQLNEFSFVHITYMTSIIILCLFCVLLCKKKDSNNRVILSTGLMLLAGTVGYAFLMSVMYLFCFSEWEMSVLASYNRYMGSYLVAEMMIMFIISIKNIRKSIDFKYVVGAALLLILVLGASNLYYIMPQKFNENDNKKFEEYADYLRDNTEEGSKIFIIADSINDYQFYIQYFVNDRSIEMAYSQIFNQDISDMQVQTDICNVLAQDDYLYVIETNDNINNNLSFINNYQPYESGRIYKVNVIDGVVSLQ